MGNGVVPARRCQRPRHAGGRIRMSRLRPRDVKTNVREVRQALKGRLCDNVAQIEREVDGPSAEQRSVYAFAPPLPETGMARTRIPPIATRLGRTSRDMAFRTAVDTAR